MSADDLHPTEILTPSECLRLLRSAEIGRLAVVVDGAPDVFPVNHLVDHGTVVFRTAHGTKLAASVGSRVAFEVDGRDGSGTVWSVVVKGRARQLNKLEDLVESHQMPLLPWHGTDKPFFVRIEPEDVSGRRFVPNASRCDGLGSRRADLAASPRLLSNSQQPLGYFWQR